MLKLTGRWYVSCSVVFLCSVVWSVETYALQKLEEQDRKALNMKEQLQREHRYLKRRLEQLSVQGLERIRTDSMGSTISTDSEQGTAQLKYLDEKSGNMWKYIQ